MPHTKLTKGLVYVVQDTNQNLCGVYSSLQLASVPFSDLVNEHVSKVELQGLSDNPEDETEEEFHPCIIVYALDSTWIWSYDSIAEVTKALQNETYEQ
jgi:hypothetical protein